MTITDIGSIREDGWQRVECDADMCSTYADMAPGGDYPDGWTHEETDSAVRTTGSSRDYCPSHGTPRP